MAAKPLTPEEIARTEKKLDMPLDDIIKMSKNSTVRTKKQQRFLSKNQRVLKNAAQSKALKVQNYMGSRSVVRQGILAQRRSNCQGNQFPLTAEVARKAAAALFGNKPFDRRDMTNLNRSRFGNSYIGPRRAIIGRNVTKPPVRPMQQQQKKKMLQQQGEGVAKQKTHTLDLLFANMKEQRIKAVLQQNNAFQRNRNSMLPRVPWARGRFGI